MLADTIAAAGAKSEKPLFRRCSVITASLKPPLGIPGQGICVHVWVAVKAPAEATYTRAGRYVLETADAAAGVRWGYSWVCVG